MSRARYIMIGGFLGAGKSTCIARLARALTDGGMRVGLITNDQGSNLVDTAALRAQGYPVEEIAGGCFCCRFNSLRAAAESLSAETRPEVFIAEPVGSCTDLVATVSYPLRRIYGNAFEIAPLSVLVDPLRALRILGVEEGRRFSEKVTYVYRKQLEEADFIVINKCDLLSDERRQRLRRALEVEYRRAELLEISARRGDGLDDWFGRILSADLPSGRNLEIDYDAYADGEALLGWLNCTLLVRRANGWDGNALLQSLAEGLQRRLSDSGTEIAHLKITLSPERFGDAGGSAAFPGEISAVNVVRQDGLPEFSHRLSGPVQSGQIIVNLRAEGAPDELRESLERELAGLRERREGFELKLEHLECFRPGRPEPTYRMPATPGTAV